MPDTDTIALPPALAAVAAGKPSEPNPAARQQAAIVQLLLQANVAQQIGGWAGDRWEQTSKYAGIPALAIRPYLNAVRAAKFTVLERVENPRDGIVSKALPSGHYGRDEGYQPLDPDHPLCRIVERPGGRRGTWSLPREAAYCTLQNLLTGDAPCWAPVNDQGKPVQFYALVSAATQLQFGAGVNPQYPQGAYRVTPAAGGYGFGLSGGVYAGAILPAEEVHRLTDEDPLYRGAGRSRMALGSKELDVLESITTSRWSFFQEGTQLDTVITIPGADAQTCKSLQEAITRAHGGANKHGRRILVVGGGGVDSKLGIQPTGMNHEEMGFLQSYEQAMGVVLALFGVPKVVAAVESGGSYAADYAAKALWYEMGLVPFFLRMSDFLTQVLADPWSEYPGQYKIEVEPPPLKNEELEEKEREFAAAQGLIMVNEYRKATGRKPVADGDVPLSVYVAKQQQAAMPQPAPGAQPGQGGNPLAALLGNSAPQNSRLNGGGDKPTAGAPPRPENPAGKGSLPPRAVAKAFNPNEKRDDDGKWTAGGAGAASVESGSMQEPKRTHEMTLSEFQSAHPVRRGDMADYVKAWLSPHKKGKPGIKFVEDAPGVGQAVMRDETGKAVAVVMYEPNGVAHLVTAPSARGKGHISKLLDAVAEKTGITNIKGPYTPEGARVAHRREVKAALARGEAVPPEVLKDYPDLAAHYAKSVTQPGAERYVRPPVAKAVNRLRTRRAAACVEAALKALEGE